MATITTTRSGNWSDETIFGPWPSPYTKPTNADTVNIGKPVLGTWEHTTDTFTAAGHGFVDGEAVVCSSSTENIAPPLQAHTVYYILYLTSSTFKLAATPGGAAINITSNGSGSRVASKHVVTLDSTSCAANDVNVYGELTCSTSTSSTLTLQQGTVVISSGHLNIDVSSNVSTVCQILLNASLNATVQQIRAAAPIATEYYGNSGKITLKGFPRKRITTADALTGGTSTSCTVADATGWQTGDKLVFATTQAFVNTSTAAKNDEVTATVSGTSISWSDGAGAGGSVANDHAANGYVANKTSNLRIGPYNTAYKASLLFSPAAVAGGSFYADNVEFYGLWDSAGNAYGVSLQGMSGQSGGTLTNCVFYNAPLVYYQMTCPLTVANNVYCVISSWATSKNAVTFTNSTAVANFTEDGSIFIGGGTTPNKGLNNAPVGFTFSNLKICGFITSASIGLTVGGTGGKTGKFSGVEVWSCYQGVGSDYGLWGQADFADCAIGTPFSASNGYNFSGLYPLKTTFLGSDYRAGVTGNISGSASSLTPWAEIAFVNRANDIDVQETITNESLTIPTFQRDTSVRTRGDASLKILGTTYGQTMHDREMTVVCSAGATIRIIGYCQVDSNFYNSGTWYAPTITVLDGTTVLATATATSAANGAWEKLDFTATNAEATSRTLTIRLRANRRGSSGYCWFSGIPFGSFVTKVRHYGFMFDEANPVRAANGAITETDIDVAYAYAAASITGSTSAMAISADTTFVNLYDYSQAWACQNSNIAYAAPITSYSLGALTANGDMTISAGKVLNGSGSLSMGGHTLSTEFASGTDYTYTGGTFSQASTTPTFSGGTLTLPTKITSGGDFSMTGATIVFGAAGADWNLSAASYSGTITLATTAGQSVTVSMPTPSGFTINNTEPGNITVTAPVVTANINITNLPVAGSVIRLQIYNMSTDSIIYSGDPGGTSYSDSYVDGVGISAGNTLRIRFVELNAGTSFKFFSMLVDATPSGFSVDANNYIETDSVYGTNGVDGSSATVTNKFSADFSLTNPQINLKITSNFIAAEYYAFWCYLLTDEVGIGIFWGGITANDVGNYQTNVGVVDMYLDNETTASQRQTDSARIYRSDGAYPVLDPTTSGYGIDLNWQNVVYVVSTGGSALTPTESAQLMALPSALTTANACGTRAVDGAKTQDEILRLMASVVGGKVSGAGTGTETFRGVNDDKDRIVATVDSSGNRNLIILDLT